MIKSTDSSSPNATELEDLKILFNKGNFDLLETKTKLLIQRNNKNLTINITDVIG